MIHLAPPGCSYKWTPEAIEDVNVGDRAQHWIPNGLETSNTSRVQTYGFVTVEVASKPRRIDCSGSLRGAVHSVEVKWPDAPDVVQTYLEYINPLTVRRRSPEGKEKECEEEA